MENKFKEIKDILISFIAALSVMILGSLMNINNKIIEYVVTNIIPLLIISITVVLNKPTVYLKYFTYKKRNKDIELSFILKYTNTKMEKEQYRDIINKFLNSYSGNIRVLRQKLGEEVCLTTFLINSVNYEMNYDDVGESLTLSISSQLNYKNFFSKVSKAADTIGDIASNSCLSFNRSFTRIKIEFLNGNNKITNPFFQKIYNGFNLKSVETRFVTKQNTTVILSNCCILFTTNKTASQLIRDIKKVISI